MAEQEVQADQANRIRVFLRIRPPNGEEEAWFRQGTYKLIIRDENATPNPETRIIIDRSNKSYDYDKVFRYDSTQKQIFKEAALPTLENVFSGYCGAIMAYGQTGTGKTHTMQGYAEKTGDSEHRGIIHRSTDYIFMRIGKMSSMIDFTVTISFVQIYLDKLQDLFKPDAPEININPETERVELPGITQHTVSSPEQLMKLYFWGEKHRVTRATKMNPTSSRGHAALIVNVVMNPKNNDGSQAVKHGKLVLVDLAGYERFAQTGITTGIAAEEAKKINASLLALGSVVNALADAAAKKGEAAKQHHIPYRNAKLTRLLKDCLGGTSVTAIILTIGPCDRYNQETSGTLYFGWRAMAVKVDARIKEVFDPKQYTEGLKLKLKASQERIKSMVGWWSRSNPSDYQKYCKQYGEPEMLSGLADDEEAEIMEALSRTQSKSEEKMRRQSQIQMGSGGSRPNLSSPTQRPPPMMDDGTGVPINENAPEEVKRVQRQYAMEVAQLNDQIDREEEALRLRHLQDLEEARASGVDAKTLENLRKAHAEEISLMQEQNMLMKQELARQKEREEVQVLLTSASSDRSLNATGAGRNSEERRRIGEIVEHLQATCESKDEVLNRMFELICYYENQLKDYSSNVQAIASAAQAVGGDDDRRALEKARRNEEELRTHLYLYQEEVEKLRSVNRDLMSGAGGGAGGAGGQPTVANSLDTQWGRAVSINSTNPRTCDLQTQALLLKEQLQGVLKQIIDSATQTSPYPPTASSPARTRTSPSPTGPTGAGGYSDYAPPAATKEKEHKSTFGGLFGGTKEKKEKKPK